MAANEAQMKTDGPFASLAKLPVSERRKWTDDEMERLRDWLAAEHRRVLATRRAVKARYGTANVDHVLAERHVEVSHQHAWRMRRLMELTFAASAGAAPMSEHDRQRAEEDWQHHAGEYASAYNRYPADSLWTDEHRQMAYFRADQRSVGDAAHPG